MRGDAMESKGKHGIKARYDIAYQPITDKQISDIAIPGRGIDLDILRSNLNEAAEQFIHDHYQQQVFKHAELEERFENIGSAAARLLLALNVNDSIVMESVLNVGLDGKLHSLKQQIDLLKTIAYDASCVQAKQKKKSKSRHLGDAAFNTLFNELRNTYTINYGKPGFTMKAGEAGGEFQSFITATLTAIRDNLSKEVKASDPSIIDSLGKSGDSIRAIHKKIKSDVI